MVGPNPRIAIPVRTTTTGKFYGTAVIELAEEVLHRLRVLSGQAQKLFEEDSSLRELIYTVGESVILHDVSFMRWLSRMYDSVSQRCVAQLRHQRMVSLPTQYLSQTACAEPQTYQRRLVVSLVPQQAPLFGWTFDLLSGVRVATDPFAYARFEELSKQDPIYTAQRELVDANDC